jgi:hypothetical protein
MAASGYRGAMRRVAWCAVVVLAIAGCEGSLSASDAGAHDATLDALAGDATIRHDAETPRDAWVERDAAVPDRCSEPLPITPGRVLFVGNSFTFTESMPTTFAHLVEASGFAPAHVEMRAVGGQSLEWHRADTSAEGAPNRVGEGWDVVILQELSTRPTDAIGDPAQFKDDATWFHDLAITAEPSCQVVLYETFARRAGHPYYPGTFTDPADMQAQLRFHYDDCADPFIPTHTTVVSEHPVLVAHVGDAWEHVLADGEPPRLHADDDYHPNANGAYLTALVFFGTLYGRSTIGLPSFAIDPAIARELQQAADAVTGATEPVPAIACPRVLPVGDTLPIDLGPNAVAGWATLDMVNDEAGPLVSAAGVATDAVARVRSFTGTQTGGSAVNALGLPSDVSADSLWVGSFDGHDAALALGAEITVTGLGTGLYRVELFASRDGDDTGNGRLTRYTLGDRSLDLEVSDNRDRAATFEGVTPDLDGAITIGVGVSPAGRARFGYAGSVRVTRTR